MTPGMGMAHVSGRMIYFQPQASSDNLKRFATQTDIQEDGFDPVERTVNESNTTQTAAILQSWFLRKENTTCRGAARSKERQLLPSKDSLHNGTSQNTCLEDVINFETSAEIEMAQLIMEAIFRMSLAVDSLLQDEIKNCKLSRNWEMCSNLFHLWQNSSQWKSNVEWIEGKTSYLSHVLSGNLLKDRLRADMRHTGSVFSVYYASRYDNTSTLKHARIATWSDGNLKWRLGAPGETLKSIHSFCPSSCLAGHFRKPTNAHPSCAFSCIACDGSTYTTESGQGHCIKCPAYSKANSAHSRCVSYKISKALAIVALCVAILGFLASFATIILYSRHREMYIVKTSDWTLSSIMLAFLSASFLSIILLTSLPVSTSVCSAHLFVVLPWPILYGACVFMKTNRLNLLFSNPGRLSGRRSLFLSNPTQIVILVAVAAVIIVFLVAWTVSSPPKYENYDGLSCTYSPLFMASYFTTALCLLLSTLISAFLAKDLPSDFREASLLAAVFFSALLWIILVPLFYTSTRVEPAVILALIVTVHGLVTYCSLFLHRVYFVVFPMSIDQVKSRKMIMRSESMNRNLGRSFRTQRSNLEIGWSTGDDGAHPPGSRYVPAEAAQRKFAESRASTASSSTFSVLSKQD